MNSKSLTNKIRNVVPAPLEAALLRSRGDYAELVDIFHCIQLFNGQWVGVAGDGENGSYEYFIFENGVLECSNVGYGSTDVALFDVLNKRRSL